MNDVVNNFEIVPSKIYMTVVSGTQAILCNSISALTIKPWLGAERLLLVSDLNTNKTSLFTFLNLLKTTRFEQQEFHSFKATQILIFLCQPTMVGWQDICTHMQMTFSGI